MFGTWSIFGNNYSLESSLISLYKLCRLDEESVKCHLQASPLILSSSLGFGWASQGHSEICPKTTPVLFWLYASVIIVLKADPSSRLMMCGAFFFFQGPLCIWLHSSLPWFWPFSAYLLRETPLQQDAAINMLHCRDAIGRLMSRAWFSPNVSLGVYFCPIRPENNF